MMRYYNKWDCLNIVLTAIVSITLIGTMFALLRRPLTDLSYAELIISLFVLLIILAMFISALLCCPIYATKEVDTLTLHFALRKRKINLRGARVRPIRKIGTFEYWRAFGCAGFCGYWGYFKKDRETFLFYLTHVKRDLCLISSPTEKYKLMINAPREWFEPTEQMH